MNQQNEYKNFAGRALLLALAILDSTVVFLFLALVIVVECFALLGRSITKLSSTIACAIRGNRV